MTFENEKKQSLKKLENDKSKKGSVDEDIIELLNLINSHPEYYTTSSCSGRIMLFKQSKTGKKHDSGWDFCSHTLTSIKEIKPFLENLPNETLWLRMEPPILHICAKDMEAADKLLKIANETGFRRSCLLSFKKRIIIEIMIPQKLDAPVAENKDLLITENYLKTLIKHANKRLSDSKKRLKKLEKLFNSLSE